MKKNTFLLFAMALILMSLIYGHEISADNGNAVKFAEGQNTANLILNPNDTLYIRFNASAGFDRFEIFFVSMQKEAITEIKLYQWEGTLPPRGNPLESEELTGVKKASYTEFAFSGKPAGEYLLGLTQKSGEAILKKYLNKRSKLDLYIDTYAEPGSIDINLYYTSPPDVDLRGLSEFGPAKHTPNPEPVYSPDAFSANIKPDTWTAVDGLGRTLPLYHALKEKRNGKAVGIFYWTWHGELSKSSKARNITEIIKQNPEAINDFKHKVWQGYTGYHHWNEPLYGYYSTNDEYVLRKHAEMLADAGIDFIAFDCTNGSYTWTESYMTLLKVFKEAKEDGVKVPKITFMSNFAAIESTWDLVKQLYKELYRPGLYHDLWFYLDGKPLMWAFPQAIPADNSIGSEILEFFTFRYPYAEGISPFDETYSWGWSGYYPNTGFGKGKNGRFEQMSLSIAINADGPMNNPNAWGRAYSHSGYSHTYTYGGRSITVTPGMENAVKYGIFIQEQWDDVIKKDPDIIFVCGWNEWVAMRHEEWGGYENAFPDQFNDEYSRDIEPSKGDLSDHYYYQLVANIRRFKGVSEPGLYRRENTIDIYGELSQWDKVGAVFNHYTGNTKKRDHEGYIGTSYASDTMRNDICTAKVAFDDNNLYFYAQTVDDLTAVSDEAWMRLYLDTDFTGISPNWEGFEYMINRTSPGSKCIVEKSKGGWDWETVCEAEYTVTANVLQIAVPKDKVNQGKIPSFSFKWSDNNCVEGDILSFYTDGDTAPGGRFCFAFNVGNKEETLTLLVSAIIAAALFIGFLKAVILKYSKIYSE